MTPKDIAKLPLTFIDSIIDRGFALAGAVVMAQFPQFVAQYLQRLGGHVDEAGRNIESYRRTAEGVGKSLEMYVQHLTRSGDSVVASMGQKITDDLARYNGLVAALKELKEATPVSKFFIFIKNMNLDIVGGTLKDFTPGVPVTAEGLCYALAGMILGMALYWLVKKAIVALARRIAGGSAAPAPAQ